ncbi:natural resistance-associated macrophage protein-domain-containing protein [Leucosporidium creatinivorum]|uniref:Natural resistance-associated macrophage protein-domain-containing protein n=1 Tax=Leucosporidium creatinivorum TaxID=106004 RepID=A0A1Y2G1U8_9BASI|nr:natural resistance-associated macrophage protein-domain-containing protein [Leucosporidium creatinivorum]
MQGPRLASHHDGIELPDILPPKGKRATLRSKFTQKPPPEEDSNEGQGERKEDDNSKGGKQDLEEGDGGGGGGLSWLQRQRKLLMRHLAFIGPGIIASVAYIDPGNWATDLQAGSSYGYSHLFIILFSGLIALLFQILATRLGCVSNHDLSTQCRLALYDRPRHKLFYRWAILYPLYALAEIGIIFTDLAELLGSAIAINLLIPEIPLYGAVLLTSLDVFLILLLFNQYPTRMVTTSMRVFEFFIGALVIVVLGSFVALLVKVDPIWKDVFRGYVPGPGIIRGGGLYIAVGIVGATVMPHAFFIGSKMATMRRLTPAEYGEDSEGNAVPIDNELPRPRRPSTSGPHLHLPQPYAIGDFDITAPRAPAPALDAEGKPSKKKEAPVGKPTLACVRAHLPHAVADIAGSLLGFAIIINSSILILAAAVFYYGEGRSSNENGVSDLFDAYELVKQYLGQAFAYLFAIALLMAGQSASLTVTLSGQIISEGFIEWHTTPWKRRLVTRLIGIIPSLAVAVSVGRQGIDVLLVGSQVALSIVLTFVLPPLIIFTSQKHTMSIPITPIKPSAHPAPAATAASARLAATASGASPLWKKRSLNSTMRILNPFRRRSDPEGHVSFANPPIVVWLASALWLLITIANVFALYALGAGLE